MTLGKNLAKGKKNLRFKKDFVWGGTEKGANMARGREARKIAGVAQKKPLTRWEKTK